jgi:arginine-tRNA-protein transferase
MTESGDTGTRVFRRSAPCVYFSDGRISETEYMLSEKNIADTYHRYLSKGYRRIGNVIYRNVCRKCSACRPLRITHEQFLMSRSQKRTMKRNEDISIEVRSPAIITGEKSRLYEKYIRSKHGDPEHDGQDLHEDTLSMMHYGYPDTIEVDYLLKNRLIGVGIVDVAKNALSSNYFYYDTDYLHRRPGIFSILNEIFIGQLLGKKYYYLGFYIAENSKMSYKKFFRPNQILVKGRWRDSL